MDYAQFTWAGRLHWYYPRIFTHESATEKAIKEAGSAGIKKEQLTVFSVRVQNSARTQVLSTEAEQQESYFPTLHLYKQSSMITHFHSLPPFKTNTMCRHTCFNAPNFLQLRSKEPKHPCGISASNIVGNANKRGQFICISPPHSVFQMRKRLYICLQPVSRPFWVRLASPTMLSPHLHCSFISFSSIYELAPFKILNISIQRLLEGTNESISVT